MNFPSPSKLDAKAFVDLFEKIHSDGAKHAFSFLMMAFSRFSGCYIEPESHGEVSSLRVRDGGDWSYSFSTAQNWVLAYVRPPEMVKGRVSLVDLQSELSDAKDRGDNHLTVRIHNMHEAEAFHRIISFSRKQS